MLGSLQLDIWTIYLEDSSWIQPPLTSSQCMLIWVDLDFWWEKKDYEVPWKIHLQRQKPVPIVLRALSLFLDCGVAKDYEVSDVEDIARCISFEPLHVPDYTPLHPNCRILEIGRQEEFGRIVLPF